MSVLKKFGKSRFATRFASGLISRYIRLVYRTSRWRRYGFEDLEALWREKRAVIGVFWHGRMLMMPNFWRKDRQLHMLISLHRDGEFIAQAIENFGFGTVRGSAARAGNDSGSLKGGAAALRSMIRLLKAGNSVAITPDGPRGPRMRVQPGVVLLAKMTGAPIVPGSWSGRPTKVMSSWDRFMLAFPFGRGVFMVGSPIYVPGDADERELERCRLAVEDSLNALTEKADLIIGAEQVEPEPEALPTPAE